MMEAFSDCGTCGHPAENRGRDGTGDLRDYEDGDWTIVVCRFCGQRKEGATPEPWNAEQRRLRNARIERGALEMLKFGLPTAEAIIQARAVVDEMDRQTRTIAETVNA